MLKEKDKEAVFKGNLNREREDERIMTQLQQEFYRIDTNQDGVLTVQEMERFLIDQSKGQVDTQLAVEIFREIDIDKNNQIPIEEFVFAYYKKQREIKDRLTVLRGDLLAHHKTKD